MRFVSLFSQVVVTVRRYVVKASTTTLLMLSKCAVGVCQGACNICLGWLQRHHYGVWPDRVWKDLHNDWCSIYDLQHLLQQLLSYLRPLHAQVAFMCLTDCQDLRMLTLRIRTCRVLCRVQSARFGCCLQVSGQLFTGHDRRGKRDNTACNMQVFRELNRRRLVEYKVGVTYVEIYNETFRDLLNPATKSSDIGVSEKR